MLTTLLENAVKEVKGLLAGYTSENVYKALIYSSIYKLINKYGLAASPLKPLEENIPRALLFRARKVLSPVFDQIILELEKLLASKKPVLITDANIANITSKITKFFRKIDYVTVYDCMSINEFILISAASRQQGFKSIIPNLALINPIGLTRYITQQLPGLDYRSILREYAHLLAERLNAKGFFKSAYIDFKVHEYGSMGIEEFTEKLNINKIISEVLDIASNGIVLVTADHGYDIIYDPDANYVYVIHGYKEQIKRTHIPLLLFSRLSLFLTVIPER